MNYAGRHNHTADVSRAGRHNHYTSQYHATLGILEEQQRVVPINDGTEVLDNILQYQVIMIIIFQYIIAANIDIP